MKSAVSRLFFVGLFLCAGRSAGQITVPLDNSNGQVFLVDVSRHLLYAGESSNAGTKHLDVINTLTNTVVGSFSYTGSGFSSQIGVSGNSVVWADQSNSLVRVIAVDNAGVPTLTRADSATLATGAAGLATTYAVNMQGTGDFMNIVNTANGSLLFHVAIGGVAGPVYSDTNTGLYYARSTNSVQVIDSSNGTILRTLNGFMTAVDSSAAHNFVYMINGANTQVLQQLSGATNSVTASFDFGSGASITATAVDAASGNVFVGLQAQNRVLQFNSNMTLLQQFTFASPEALAFADGELFVHLAGTSSVSVLAIPEPGTWLLLSGGLAVLGIFQRRRARGPTRSPA